MKSFLMTTKDTKETSGPPNTADGSEAAGNLAPQRSFTTLSTIAVQAGESQIIVSVLQV